MERKTNEVFQAKITVKADASGFSFQNLQDDLMGNEDDWVIFDPSADPLVPDRLAGLDRHDLRSVRLSELLEWRYIIENEDIQQRETIDQTARDLFPKARIADDKSESWFIDLWDNSIRADVREELPKSLDRRRLAKYFSWISEPPNGEAAAPSPERNGDAQQVEEKPRPTEFFNLIARQSSDNNLTNFSKLESLLNEPPAEILAEFVPLPDDFEISRQHDRGGCQVSRDDEKASKLYIIQTPFYSTGFWSLLLYTMVDSTVGEGLVKLSGVIQVDAGVNLTNVFHDIRGLVARYGHHQALLPLQLFMSHYKATEKAFTSIQEEVGEVDDNLFDHLKEEGKLDDASKLYRKLSMNLHKCSMNIAELSRRRKFENELGSCLLEDLKNDDLRVLVQIYLRMSRSRDSDIKSLHGKIESQRNVLYNLITQHDSYLQARLARESLRDSKAMKTLSILTILFLPGAFIATIFSTNMFDFKSKNQQVRIYFAIVIPLTAVLMICWVLWLKNTPERGDEESARRYRRVMSMNWPKEGKED
ncbi:hypothetical protein H9Q74_011520 [Fusarium xylarioides]|nr:hypothetical protein H9Q71_011623 [Fusarium xylarioides]KAG5815736.1 hypothetical protein H9Q74_011520 [Fusarium xylarioides]